MRVASLWVAYALLVLTSWYGLWSIGNDLESLEDDVCGAIVLDLRVQAGIVSPTDPEGADEILSAIDDVTEQCGG